MNNEGIHHCFQEPGSSMRRRPRVIHIVGWYAMRAFLIKCEVAIPVAASHSSACIQNSLIMNIV